MAKVHVSVSRKAHLLRFKDVLAASNDDRDAFDLAARSVNAAPPVGELTAAIGELFSIAAAGDPGEHALYDPETVHGVPFAERADDICGQHIAAIRDLRRQVIRAARYGRMNGARVQSFMSNLRSADVALLRLRQAIWQFAGPRKAGKTAKLRKAVGYWLDATSKLNSRDLVELSHDQLHETETT